MLFNNVHALVVVASLAISCHALPIPHSKRIEFNLGSALSGLFGGLVGGQDIGTSALAGVQAGLAGGGQAE